MDNLIVRYRDIDVPGRFYEYLHSNEFSYFRNAEDAYSFRDWFVALAGFPEEQDDTPGAPVVNLEDLR